MSYTNADGLRILTNGDAGVAAENGVNTVSAKKTMLVNIDLTKGDQALNNGEDAFIPAGSYITAASLVVKTAASGGTNVTIGLINAAGSDIDADGIDATIALSAINATTKAVACDGALVGGAVMTGAADAYIKANYGTAAFTAGAAKLVITYIET